MPWAALSKGSADGRAEADDRADQRQHAGEARVAVAAYSQDDQAEQIGSQIARLRYGGSVDMVDCIMVIVISLRIS
jgi:hypothetical protein